MIGEKLAGGGAARTVRRAARAGTQRDGAARGIRAWRLAIIVMVGVVAATLVVALPLLRHHPFTLLYAYVVFAAWYGDLWDGAVAVALGTASTAALLPRFPALPLEEALFVLSSLGLLALIGRLRETQRAARRAQRRAEEALLLRDEVLAALSHDLKAPLTSIKGTAQLLRRRVGKDGGPADARVTEGLDQIDATATAMARLLNELLDVARLQASQPLALDLRPTDLVALTRELAAAHQQATDQHRLRVDAVLPELVLGNLLSNAIKYSPAGGDVVVTLDREGEAAVLSVRDEGIGIPAADVPRLFERFQRAGNVSDIAGTGLGLATARQIVEQHGGTIGVSSIHGAGTTVTVRLPLPAATPAYDPSSPGAVAAC
jgi:signal transduction histidine kinase